MYIEPKITIQEVIDTSTGKMQSSTVLLNHFNRSWDDKSDIRTRVHDAICKGEPMYLCASCHQPVRLNGGHQGERKQALHFKHSDKHDGCIYTDYRGLTREEINRLKFHGLAEGETHLMMKETLCDVLEMEGYTAVAEKRVTLIKDIGELSERKTKKLWRQPDVQATNDKHSLIFEIQLATTSIDVIKARMDFYSERQMHILWVVHELDESKTPNFTQADIMAYCNRNIFVFDNEMIELSKEKEKLHLRCQYRVPFVEDDSITFRWGSAVVTLDELTYDNEHFIAYYYDSEGEKVKLANECGILELEDSVEKLCTDGYLDINKTNKLTLQEFIDTLASLTIHDLYNISDAFLENVKSFKNTNDLKDEFTKTELLQLLYVVFMRRLKDRVTSDVMIENYRQELSEVTAIEYLAKLTSYPYKQVIGSYSSDLAALTEELYTYYRKYAHISAAIIRKYDYDRIVADGYNQLCKHAKEHYVSHEYDLLAKELFGLSLSKDK